MSYAKVHYYTIPCKTFSPFGINTTENKAEITCDTCLNHEDLPRYSKKRSKFKKIERVKLIPKVNDHFKYRRMT